jgi:hypothetical protein
LGSRFSSCCPRGEADVVRAPGGYTGPGADATRTPDAGTISGVDAGYRSKVDSCLSCMGVMPFSETTSSWRNPTLFLSWFSHSEEMLVASGGTSVNQLTSWPTLVTTLEGIKV